MDYAPILAAVAVITCAGLLGGWIFRLSSRLAEADAKAEAAGKESASAIVAVATLRVVLDQAERDLNDHRVAVAREYASNATLAALETKLIQAIDRLGDRLDRLFVAAPSA